MDIGRIFREYASLEKKRAEGELSSRDLARWTACKTVLAKRLTPGLDPKIAARRGTARVPTRLGISFSSVGEIRQCLMTDLSTGGLFIQTDRPIDIGTRLDLSIRIGDRNSIVKVQGVVATHNVGPNFTTNQRGMGLRFLDMDEATQKQVEELYEHSVRRATDPIPPD